MIKNTALLLFFIALCLSAGIIGSYFTYSSLENWYPYLKKPFFNPPNYLFGPVWTVLYILMGISIYLVWGNKKVNLNWFWTQLGLNVFWSVAFFGLKSPLIGFIVIIATWFTICKTIQEFYKYNKMAAYLLIPYIAWVTFATLLNFSIMILNF